MQKWRHSGPLTKTQEPKPKRAMLPLSIARSLPTYSPHTVGTNTF
jgi:hypothetical protein